MGAVFLVRHGQASFGTDDYDRLSARGAQQASALGHALGARVGTPDLLVAGEMRRHHETARQAMAAAAWPDKLCTDARWNEFDHAQVMDVYPHQPSALVLRDPRTFQSWFERSTQRWTDGEFDLEYVETFAAFSSRAKDALDDVRGQLGPRRTAVVFTSGGVIASIACALIGAGTEQWHLLNRVAVNVGVTTLVLGRGGVSMASYNEHGHLPIAALTYR